jgi:hypothetical protein
MVNVACRSFQVVYKCSWFSKMILWVGGGVNIARIWYGPWDSIYLASKLWSSWTAYWCLSNKDEHLALGIVNCIAHKSYLITEWCFTCHQARVTMMKCQKTQTELGLTILVVDHLPIPQDCWTYFKCTEWGRVYC